MKKRFHDPLLTAARVILTLLMGLMIAIMIQPYSDRLHVEGKISFHGLLLTLVLFILARVFRHGTTLRTELEGTV